METSKEKQIEEMAYSVCRLENKPKDCASCMWKATCNEYLSAESYYNAGYRKQSEGEWKDHYLIKVKCPDNGYPSVKCSECETVFCDIINNHHFMYHLCPNCGARMKGGEG